MTFTTALHWVALICEPAGVFFLSVEAIKLGNLRRVNAKLRDIYSAANPRIEWIDSDAPRPPPDPSTESPLYRTHSGVITFFITVFVATPLVLILYPAIALFERIDARTPSGSIGIIGFMLWFLSFVLNHI